MTTQPMSMPAHTVESTELAVPSRKGFWVIVSLLTVYIVWGTTYLAVRVALGSFPPYLLLGIRFTIAGTVLLGLLMAAGATLPTRRQWRNAAIVGAFILVGGTGSVVLAQERAISSGLAATLVATVPIWTMIFNLYWKKKPSRWEWLGVGLGIFGVALLTTEGNVQSNPIGVLIILFAAANWAFGSVLSPHLDMPKGIMANAAEMLLAGLMFLVFSVLRGEAMVAAPNTSTLLALTYLITFGSLAGMSAYIYLLDNVSSLLATSYTFVNPAIALFLGVILVGETLTGSAFLALPLILVGVGFVAYQNRKVK